MRRYLVFVYGKWERNGGWDDFLGDYSSIDEALKAAATSDDDIYQVIDSREREEVYTGEVYLLRQRAIQSGLLPASYPKEGR